MQNQLIKNLIIASLTTILLICSLLFLFNHHTDTLIHSLPSQNTTAYLHFNKTTLNKIENKKINYFFDWFNQNNHNNLDNTIFKTLININTKEIALFNQKNKLYLAINNTKYNQTYLKSQNLPYSISKNALIIPEIDSFEADLDNSSWIANKFFDFSDVKLLLSNTNILNIEKFNNINIPLAIYANTSKNQLLINIFGQNIGQNNQEIVNSGLILPKNTKIYLNNTLAPYIAINKDQSSFSYNLFSQINGPIKYIETTDNQFIAKFNKKNNSQENILNAIKQSLAYELPSIEFHELPDKSYSQNLIANPDKWTFNSFINTKKLVEPELDLNLTLRTYPDYYLLMNNVNQYSLDNSTNPLILPLKNNQTFAYSKDIFEYLIINKNINNLAVCIQ